MYIVGRDEYRILHDHSSVTGVHSQALDTLQEKLSDAEASLRLEAEEHRKTKVGIAYTITCLPRVFFFHLVSWMFNSFFCDSPVQIIWLKLSS